MLNYWANNITNKYMGFNSYLAFKLSTEVKGCIKKKHRRKSKCSKGLLEHKLFSQFVSKRKKYHFHP